MNRHLLVSDAEHFRVDYEINPFMAVSEQPSTAAAIGEHDAIVAAHRDADRTVERIPSDADYPDMVFTANAALVRGDCAILGNPPAARAGEIDHHRAWLRRRGYRIVDAPYAFSGQGDALPCGEVLLAGYGGRTDARMHDVLRRELGYEVVPLRTADRRWYDLDLAVAVIDNPHTVAWCPEALDESSGDRLRSLGLDLIAVSVSEARHFGLNLISDGNTVTMNQAAPQLAEELRRRGLRVIELPTTELAKGGGGVRCTALTLDSS